jgi:hypothetical protein
MKLPTATSQPSANTASITASTVPNVVDDERLGIDAVKRQLESSGGAGAGHTRRPPHSSNPQHHQQHHHNRNNETIVDLLMTESFENSCHGRGLRKCETRNRMGTRV